MGWEGWTEDNDQLHVHYGTTGTVGDRTLGEGDQCNQHFDTGLTRNVNFNRRRRENAGGPTTRRLISKL
jgi:hypothetical protein